MYSDESMAAFVPAGVYVLAGAVNLVVQGDASWVREAAESARDDPTGIVTALVLLALQSLAGAIVAVWAIERRRLDRRTRRRWILVGLLFGPAAALAVLAIYPRILRDACPSCGKPTRVDMCQCQECGSSLDEARRTGIEIFDHEKGPPETVEPETADAV